MSGCIFDLGFKALQPLTDAACGLLWRSIWVGYFPLVKPICYGCAVSRVVSVMPRNGQTNTIEDLIRMKDNGVSGISSFLNYGMVGFCPRNNMVSFMPRRCFQQPSYPLKRSVNFYFSQVLRRRRLLELILKCQKRAV